MTYHRFSSQHNSYKMVFLVVFFFFWGGILAGCKSASQATKDAIAKTTQEKVMAVSASRTGSLFKDPGQLNALIKAGDQIEINVWGYPEFNTTTTVKDGGMIIVPLIGELKAGGLTKDEFAALLSQKLNEYVSGEVKATLSVTSPSIQKITVLGSVTRQDNYPVKAEVSLMEILSSAGGTTAESDLHRVKILRYGNYEDPTIVDVAWYIETGNTDSMPMVRPGDTVYVPKKENLVREFTEFLRDAVLLFGFFRVFY